MKTFIHFFESLFMSIFAPLYELDILAMFAASQLSVDELRELPADSRRHLFSLTIREEAKTAEQAVSIVNESVEAQITQMRQIDPDCVVALNVPEFDERKTILTDLIERDAEIFLEKVSFMLDSYSEILYALQKTKDE